MDYKNIIVEKDDRVVLITLNREKALNALNSEIIGELLDFFQTSRTDKTIGCVIITGGGKAFVAGADVAELAKCDVKEAVQTSTRGHYLMKMIESFPRPVIAAINGFALGGGCELALACDIRLASEKAKFGQPEVGLGIIPGYGGTQRMARMVGKGKAKQLMLTGEIISAAEAYRIGLADEIYPHDELLDKAKEMARSIALKGPYAVTIAKECVNRGIDINLTAGCDLEIASFGTIYGTKDALEGLNAFLEKRPPKFKGE
jgi:enoyl-CoA hydratase